MEIDIKLSSKYEIMTYNNNINDNNKKFRR